MTPPPTMRRTLGRFEVTCLGINAIVGAGIFALPDDLFREVGGRSPLVFIVCALGLLPIAWCYAEAASTTERSGGPYVYVRQAFGPVPGYVVGWMCFANSVFSFAAVSHIAAAYLLRMLGLAADAWAARLLAITIVFVFCALNALGARPGARVAVVFTLAKLAALFVLLAAAVPAMDPSRLALPAAKGGSLSQAIFLGLFAAQGFEVAPVPAGETVEARRVMPFATLASLLGASALYVLVQAVVVAAHPGLATPSETPLAEAALAVAPRLGAVVVWGGVVSTLGFVAGNAFGTPRYAYAMAQDGYLPRALAYVGATRGAPIGALAATAACASIMSGIFSESALFAISNLAVAVQYLGTCLSIARGALRPGAAGAARRSRGVRLFMAIAGAAVSVWILGKGTEQERLFALGALAAGLLLGFGSRLTARARPSGS